MKQNFFLNTYITFTSITFEYHVDLCKTFCLKSSLQRFTTDRAETCQTYHIINYLDFNSECNNIGDDQYLCPICPSKSFDSPNDLHGHLKEAHLESIVKANISKEKVKVIKILKGNVLEDEIKVSKNKSLQEILEEESEERQNPDDITEQKCPEPECNENFTSMLNLAEHYYDEHNKMRSKDFKCPICFKGHTKGKLSYLVHVRSDHLNATKKCPECDAVLKLQSYSTHRCVASILVLQKNNVS